MTLLLLATFQPKKALNYTKYQLPTLRRSCICLLFCLCHLDGWEMMINNIALLQLNLGLDAKYDLLFHASDNIHPPK